MTDAYSVIFRNAKKGRSRIFVPTLTSTVTAFGAGQQVVVCYPADNSINFGPRELPSHEFQVHVWACGFFQRISAL